MAPPPPKPFPSPAMTLAEANPYGLLMWFMQTLNLDGSIQRGAAVPTPAVVKIGNGDYWVTPGLKLPPNDYILAVSLVGNEGDTASGQTIKAMAQNDGTVRVQILGSDGETPEDGTFSLFAFKLPTAGVDAPAPPA